jgi:hypothetical protein
MASHAKRLPLRALSFCVWQARKKAAVSRPYAKGAPGATRTRDPLLRKQPNGFQGEEPQRL